MAKRKAKDTTSAFELDGEVLELDLDSLTFGEIEEVEIYFDCPVDQVRWDSGRGGLMAAYLAKKRKNPKTTLNDLRSLKISALKEVKPKRPTGKTPEQDGSPS